jgi:hypothetical protein
MDKAREYIYNEVNVHFSVSFVDNKFFLFALREFFESQLLIEFDVKSGYGLSNTIN